MQCQYTSKSLNSAVWLHGILMHMPKDQDEFRLSWAAHHSPKLLLVSCYACKACVLNLPFFVCNYCAFPKHANTEGQSATQYLYIFYYVYSCPRSSSVCSYFIVYGLSDLVSIAV